MDDHREGIQADQPVPPWERAGCFRLDCEPHRATLLNVMGNASVFIGGISIFLPLVPGSAGSFPGFLATLFIGLVISPLLSLTTWLLARSDLSKMQMGWVDPSGEERVRAARDKGLHGLVINLICVLLWGLALLSSSLMRV